MQLALNLGVDADADMAVNGLSYRPDYAGSADEAELLARIDRQPWRADLKRRVQHYGYRYDYRARSVGADDFLGPLPDWLARLADRLAADGLFAASPDQAIVNEYLPGQGIAPHIDCAPCFGGVIASLSLGSACVMELSNDQTGARAPVLLEPGSLVVLSGEARYVWRHGIAPRKSDRFGDVVITRRRRVSVTFRNVVGIERD